MPIDEVSKDVQSFFDSYLTSFERMDVTAVADHFMYPLQIIADGSDVHSLSIEHQQEWVGQLERLLAMYRAVDFQSAKIKKISEQAISERLKLVTVQWSLYNSKNALLYNFTALYTLVSTNDGLKIAAIAHDEIIKYRQCFASLKP